MTETLQLEIDGCEAAESHTSSTAPIADPVERYFQNDVIPLQVEYDSFINHMQGIALSQDALEKRYEYFYPGMERKKFLHDTYGRFLDLVRKFANDAIGEVGISNFTLPSKISCYEQGDNPKEWESPLAYWKRITSDLDSYRAEGLKRHADTLYNGLLGMDYARECVTSTKSGFAVEVMAQVSGYSWENGYTFESCTRLLRILESIRTVVTASGIDNCYMQYSISQLLENFKSRAKEEYCSGVVLQTFKHKVIFHLSFEVMEAIQLFISEHRPDKAEK